LESNTFVARQISQQKVKCLNHGGGCEWTGELGMEEKNLADHMQVCEENEFSCPRCSQSVKVSDAQMHGDEDCIVQSEPKQRNNAAGVKRKRKA
jgi:hypothetical protein